MIQGQGVDVVADVFVESALEVATLLQFAHGAPHDVGNGRRDQAEMKFQFKSRKRVRVQNNNQRGP